MRSGKALMIVQCENGHLHSDLISCAMYRVVDELSKQEYFNTISIVFVIQLPRKIGQSTFCII